MKELIISTENDLEGLFLKPSSTTGRSVHCNFIYYEEPTMFTLDRVYHEDKTTGVFTFPNGEILYSLERPWLDNKVSVSCIPEGDYVVKRDRTGRHQWWAIQDVPGRTFIEIHEANRVSQLEGCIALGCGFNGDGSLVQSRLALEKLLAFHGDDGFILRIREAE